jgi:hypothetical protein
MSLLDAALSYVRRGWYVFPCKPKNKFPHGGLVRHGFKDATLDEDLVKSWWSLCPTANIGIDCGRSELCVLDVDEGNADLTDFVNFMDRNHLPMSYAVRTGRRLSKTTEQPEFGVQLYYKGTRKSIQHWVLDHCSGDIKSVGGLVLAAGSIHPDSGEAYEVLFDEPLARMPEWVRTIEATPIPGAPGKSNGVWNDPGGKITERRAETMLSMLGKKRSQGADDSDLETYALDLNVARFEPPISDELMDKLIADACKYECTEPDPGVMFGGKITRDGVVTVIAPELEDWRTHYHTHEAFFNAPEPVFIIDQFLQYESITAIAAPVGQRKSIIGLNIADAVCSGRPLFDKFKVITKVERVLYLCPEMGIRSFADRVRKMGLMEYVGKTLFIRTMSPVNPDLALQEELTLDQLQADEVSDAVVVIDTTVRFIKGDENSAEHMRVFAKSIFKLTKLKAAAVVVLFHSSKGTKEAPELNLENALRGSGELGAFLTCCWATRLQDPDDEYASKSFLKNVKPRDFDAKPFEIIGTRDADGGIVNDCRMHWVDNGDAKVTLSKKAGGVTEDADGMRDVTVAIIKSNPTMTIAELQEEMKTQGIKKPRCASWISKKRTALKGTGVKLTN